MEENPKIRLPTSTLEDALRNVTGTKKECRRNVTGTKKECVTGTKKELQKETLSGRSLLKERVTHCPEKSQVDRISL